MNELQLSQWRLRYLLATEATQLYLCHILVVTRVSQTAEIEEGEIRLHLLMGERQGSGRACVAGDTVGGHLRKIQLATPPTPGSSEVPLSL